MTGIDLQEHVLAFFRAEAGRFGLDAGSLAVRHALNWGGFVSHSYHVGDGRRSAHTKLAGRSPRAWTCTCVPSRSTT
jgi:hypothetical protein